MQHREAPGLCKDLGAIKRTSPKMLVHAASKPHPAAAHGSARSVTQCGYALAEGCAFPACCTACMRWVGWSLRTDGCATPVASRRGSRSIGVAASVLYA